ncbi:hypothetical protein BSKO_12788 [Bryopsis sp. KO-2023]|nr:hypothetical protein BSKO_12788 [Bryopsis sp. KO-2023]
MTDRPHFFGGSHDLAASRSTRDAQAAQRVCGHLSRSLLSEATSHVPPVKMDSVVAALDGSCSNVQC